MSHDLLFICGGAWAGKTERASSIACTHEHVVWIGTAAHTLPDLSHHIEQLKSRRPEHWAIVDAPFNLAEAIKTARMKNPGSVLVIDSVSQWVSNEIAKRSGRTDERQLQDSLAFDLDELISIIRDSMLSAPVIAVSSDFGSALPPQEPAVRVLRKTVGHANQSLSALAGRTEIMMAGIVICTKSAEK